jgi:hypothetical protein
MTGGFAGHAGMVRVLDAFVHWVMVVPLNVFPWHARMLSSKLLVPAGVKTKLANSGDAPVTLKTVDVVFKMAPLTMGMYVSPVLVPG